MVEAEDLAEGYPFLKMVMSHGQAIGCVDHHWIITYIYSLVNKQKAIENGPVEIVDLPS
jgi:hypothetical protein